MTLGRILTATMTRFPSTMLLKPSIRKECREYIRKNYENLFNPAIMGAALFLTFIAKTILDSFELRSAFSIGGWIFGPPEIVFLFAQIPICLWPLRQKVLIPACLRQRLERAENRFRDLAEDYNDRVPDSRYRIQYLPKASLSSIDTVQNMLNERRLPSELESAARSTIKAHRELTEMEAEYAILAPTSARASTDPT